MEINRKNIFSVDEDNILTFTDTINSLNEAVFVVLDDIFVCYNDEFVKITEYEKKELEKITYLDLIYNKDLIGSIKNNYSKIIKNEYSEKYKLKIITEKKIIIDAHLKARPITWFGKDAAIMTLTDITKFLKSNKELQNRDNLIQDLLGNMRDVFYRVDKNGTLLYATNSILEMYGYDNMSELLGKNIGDVLYEDKSELKRVNKSFEKSGYVKNLVVKNIRKNKSIIYVEINANTIYDINNKSIGAEGILRDITERFINQEAIKEAQAATYQLYSFSEKTKNLLRIIIDTTDDVIFAKNNAGAYLLVNKLFAEIAEISSVQIKGLEDKDLLNESNRINFEQFTKLTPESKIRYGNYLKVTTKEGNERIYMPSINTINIKDSDEEIMVVIAKDLTRILRAEKELVLINKNLEKIIDTRTDQLKRSEENFKKLFEDSNDSIIISYFDGKIADSNNKISKLLGYPREDLIFMNIDDITIAEYRAKRSDFVQEIRKAGSKMYENIFITKSGKQIPAEVSSTIIKYDNQEVILSTIRDISERKEMQKKVLKAVMQTEETERKRFAQELHDGLGAILSAIKMYIDLLATGNVPEEKTASIFEGTKKLIDEAADTAREVANNIKPHLLTNFGLSSSIKTLCNRIEETGKIKINFHISDYLVRLNEDLELALYRVINELINNTLKHSDATEIIINIRINNNKLILLYTDNGNGFDLEKELDSGKGSGLKNIRNRIETINGICKISSFEGKGVFVKIKLSIKDFQL